MCAMSTYGGVCVTRRDVCNECVWHVLKEGICVT